MNRLLVVAILLISTVPLFAQRQQQNVAKLKDVRPIWPQCLPLIPMRWPA